MTAHAPLSVSYTPDLASETTAGWSAERGLNDAGYEVKLAQLSCERQDTSPHSSGQCEEDAWPSHIPGFLRPKFHSRLGEAAPR